MQVKITELEQQTGLTTKELQIIKQQAGFKQPNRYAAFLYVLINGVDNQTITTESDKIGDKEYAANEMIFNAILKGMNSNIGFKKAVEKTPAFKNNQIKEYGCAGVTFGSNASTLPTNPIIGGQKNAPTLIENALNKIHPQFTEKLEEYLIKIKTKAYLSLPASAMGSIQSIVSKITKALVSFQSMIMNIYQGALDAIQKLYTQINAIFVRIQQLMVNVIEQIVPLDLITLIVETIQSVLDDVNFFTGLFGQSLEISQYINSAQQYINMGTNFINNPFTTIMSSLPEDVNNIIQLVNQVGSDPNGFLADQLNNYGYGYALNAIQGNILGAAINKFGPQYAAIGPITNILTSVENFPQPRASYPTTPASLGPNIYTKQVRNPDGTLIDKVVNFYNGSINPKPPVSTDSYK
jgi:hypothetical protein